MKNTVQLGKPFGKISIAVAGLVTVLLCADVVAGPGAGVAADSALAMFLLGLAVGVPAGIGLFFGYLVLRERRHIEQEDDLDALFESLETEEDPWIPPAKEKGIQFDRDTAFRENEEEPIESLDPWERPADWWRDSDS